MINCYDTSLLMIKIYYSVSMMDDIGLSLKKLHLIKPIYIELER